MVTATEQVSTFPTTAQEIMSDSGFGLGVADVRAGHAPRPDYDLWETNTQWNYERGRVWGLLAPRGIQLKRAGKVTSEAIAWYLRFQGSII
jgi:hypothetical protein